MRFALVPVAGLWAGATFWAGVAFAFGAGGAFAAVVAALIWARAGFGADLVTAAGWPLPGAGCTLAWAGTWAAASSSASLYRRNLENYLSEFERIWKLDVLFFVLYIIFQEGI